MRSFAPRAGRSVGKWLHGNTWLTKGHGSKLDWRHFADVCHFTLAHVLFTGFVLSALAPEVASWARAPEQWWSFSQPPLSSALRYYYLVQIAANLESAIAMLLGLLGGRAKDRPMLIHHATTLFVISLAWRLGFVRVGAMVAMLHDATDLPIDCLRLSQALESFPMVAASATSAIVTWGVLRGYAFPRLIIWSALMHTGHMWSVHSYAPSFYITIGYILLILPLAVLWLLSMHWLRLLSIKMRTTLATSQGLSKEQLDAATATIAATIIAAAVGIEQLATSTPTTAPPPPRAKPKRPPLAPSLPPAQQFFAVDSIRMLRTPHCGYYNGSATLSAPIYEHLHPTVPSECDLYDLMACDADVFDGAVWTRWSSENWQYPLIAVTCYLLAIPILQV